MTINQEYTLEPEELRVLGDHPLWILPRTWELFAANKKETAE